MIFKKMELDGVYLISLDKQKDERGFFARSFCKNEFIDYGLCAEWVQCNFSYNVKRGTLRGMHYQKDPYEEAKLVSCIRGSIYDVILDIRKTSKTYGKWITIKLTSENNNMLYIPIGMAHGFQTLEDHSVVYYQMGEYYHPESACGIRFDDKRFSIIWPINEKIISEKDLSYIS